MTDSRRKVKQCDYGSTSTTKNPLSKELSSSYNKMNLALQSKEDIIKFSCKNYTPEENKILALTAFSLRENPIPTPDPYDAGCRAYGRTTSPFLALNKKLHDKLIKPACAKDGDCSIPECAIGTVCIGPVVAFSLVSCTIGRTAGCCCCLFKYINPEHNIRTNEPNPPPTRQVMM